MVRLSRGAVRGNRVGPGRGRGMGLPPPLMARNNVIQPPIPPRMPPRMRQLPPGMRSPPHGMRSPPHGMRSPPHGLRSPPHGFASPIPPPHPLSHPHPHMRHPPPGQTPPHGPPMRRHMPFPPPLPPHRPMFPPHGGPMPRMHPHPPPLIRGRGRFFRGVGTQQVSKMRKLDITQFKSKKVKKIKPPQETTEGDFFCVNCDVGFKSEDKLEQHRSEHVVCGIDGCTLTAHGKIINKHIQLQHDTGLYCKIANKTTPTEISDWIKERKSKYPTKKNTEEKDCQAAEMEQRGERLRGDNARFLKKNYDNKKYTRTNTKGRSQRRKGREMSKPTNKGGCLRGLHSTPMTSETDQQDSWHGTLPHFPGTAMFPEVVESEEKPTNEEVYSDTEWADDSICTEVSPQKFVNPLASVLAALNDAYGSESESDDVTVTDKPPQIEEIPKVATECTPVSKESTNETINEENSVLSNCVVSNADDSDSGPEEVSVLRKGGSDPLSTSQDVHPDDNTREGGTKRSSRKRKHAHKDTKMQNDHGKKHFERPVKYIPRKRLTLLQKLLEPEIRHERNVILQCVRYIVQNNFFDIVK